MNPPTPSRQMTLNEIRAVDVQHFEEAPVTDNDDDAHNHHDGDGSDVASGRHRALA